MICHDILFDKLTRLGFSNSGLLLLKSYLHNRKQQVNIDGHYSNELPLNYGVPQGSILGPLLFLIYINDLDKHVKHGELFLFADDTTLIFAHKNLNLLVSFINQDLSHINNYCLSNKLILNSTKTEAMFFGPKKSINYSQFKFCFNGIKLNWLINSNFWVL